ncbi:MAG: hypothetical protein IJ557_02475 [Bacteroidaceae bacterium]|nr:hypothetical protein [Bacteroidaceae bacterium]
MLWFEQKQRKLEMLQSITPTSKTSLKQQCLIVSRGNLKEAKELYDFFASDIPSLPDTDPIPPTWQQNTANTINSVLSWVRDNQDTLVQGYQFVQNIIANKGVLPAMPTAALPSINEE